MKKFTQIFNSPKKLVILAAGTVLIIGTAAFATVRAGANVIENKTIGLDKGVLVALQDAGLKQDEVSNLIAHYDKDDGIASYDIEFRHDNVKYEYTIKASDGTILEADRDTLRANAPQKPQGEQTGKDLQAQNQKPQPAQQNQHAQQNQQPQPAQKQPANASNPEAPTAKYIGADKAKAIALNHAGISAANAAFTKAALDRDDGLVVYEVEFFSGNIEYDYEIDAVSGEIRSYSSETEEFGFDD